MNYMNIMNMNQMDMYQLFNNYICLNNQNINNLFLQNNSNIFNQNINNNNFMFYNNINNNNNNNNINTLNNNINNFNKETIPKEILPRENKWKYFKYPTSNTNLNETINIIFIANTGIKTRIIFPKNKTLNELFCYYAKKNGN